MPEIIFVGGVHGVGKTQLCKHVAEAASFAHVSASELIRQTGVILPHADKKVDHVESNQDRLLIALKAYETRQAKLLLDGHFCLLDMQNRIRLIPLSIFKAISPKAILVLTDEVSTIQQRIHLRDGNTYSLDLILEFQTKEIDYAGRVSNTLSIPFMVADPDTSPDEVIRFINRAER